MDLVDVGAFYDGYNGLSELEDAFAFAFESLECPDLAALVRGGNEYQRLPFVIGSYVSDLPNLFLAFRQLVLGKDSKPTFEEWKKEAWGKYKGHPFLAVVSMLLCVEYRHLGQREDNHIHCRSRKQGGATKIITHEKIIKSTFDSFNPKKKHKWVIINPGIFRLISSQLFPPEQLP